MNKLMILANEDGHISVEEATVDSLIDNAGLLYKLAVKGIFIHKDLLSHDVPLHIEDVIMAIRHSCDAKDVCKNLQNEFGIKKQTAEYILSVPLTELGIMSADVVQKRL